MAKYTYGQKVRIQGTAVNAQVRELFDDGENSRYLIALPNGEARELPESELRPTIKDEAVKAIQWYCAGDKDAWVRLALTFCGGYLAATIIRML